MLPEGSPKLGAVQGAMDELFVPEATESGSGADTRPVLGLRSFRGICGGEPVAARATAAPTT